MTDINECSICLELLDKTYQIYILECAHQYHTTCLTDWYKNPISNYKCPLCNEKSDIINVTCSSKTIDTVTIKTNTNRAELNNIVCNQINNIHSYKTIPCKNIAEKSINLENHKKICVIL